jgi:hypothetical protein
MRTAHLPCLLLLAAGLLTIGCGSSSSAPSNDSFVYQNQIFTSTAELGAAASNPDTGRPSFSWPATGLKHVVVAIFRAHIDVQSNLIVNTDQVVWIWHTGIGRGREGNVTFDDGASAVDDEGRPQGSPSTLQGGTYYWAVWALDEEGTPVESSIEYQLDVP